MRPAHFGFEASLKRASQFDLKEHLRWLQNRFKKVLLDAAEPPNTLGRLPGTQTFCGYA